MEGKKSKRGIIGEGRPTKRALEVVAKRSFGDFRGIFTGLRRLDRSPALPKYGNASRTKKTTSRNWRSPKVKCDGLFTNRLLWLSASAGAVFSFGLRLPQPRPAGAFMNKPHTLPELLPNLLFAEVDSHNGQKRGRGGLSQPSELG